MKCIHEDNQLILKRAVYQQGPRYFELCFFPQTGELEVYTGFSAYDVTNDRTTLYDRHGGGHSPRGLFISNEISLILRDHAYPWKTIKQQHLSYFLRLVFQ